MLCRYRIPAAGLDPAPSPGPRALRSRFRSLFPPSLPGKLWRAGRATCPANNSPSRCNSLENQAFGKGYWSSSSCSAPSEPCRGRFDSRALGCHRLGSGSHGRSPGLAQSLPKRLFICHFPRAFQADFKERGPGRFERRWIIFPAGRTAALWGKGGSSVQALLPSQGLNPRGSSQAESKTPSSWLDHKFLCK